LIRGALPFRTFRAWLPPLPGPGAQYSQLLDGDLTQESPLDGAQAEANRAVEKAIGSSGSSTMRV